MTTQPGVKSEPGSRATHDVFPIFLCEDRPAPEVPAIVEFRGTGFRLAHPRARDALITCWHCLGDEPDGHGYAVAVQENGHYRLHPLLDVAQDANGTDLATARVFELTVEPAFGLRLAMAAVAGGWNVGTWGYPFVAPQQLPSGDLAYNVDGRWLQGYVTRSLAYDHPAYGSVASYEVDMPAPEGLSGAPLLTPNTREVLGVIYGRNEVGVIDQFASVDADTGERRPELQRIVSFALAHFTGALHALIGPATGGVPLVEYLAES